MKSTQTLLGVLAAALTIGAVSARCPLHIVALEEPRAVCRWYASMTVGATDVITTARAMPVIGAREGRSAISVHMESPCVRIASETVYPVLSIPTAV
ncbi:unnamed protein product [Zymoseptoria tritici ST99CH_1E4]|uniref:Uncharacterized protein n=1 Tax=Zymoseptoria tritici ST99CH_1E4 TaxID=1276532 RepID=A0A2H1H4L9_ZYMTR|nr:unnamed protein product [Zymoseptoria tritici ST99CH_1E4]